VCSKTTQKHLLTANCAEFFQNDNFKTPFRPFLNAFPKNQSLYEISRLEASAYPLIGSNGATQQVELFRGFAATHKLRHKIRRD
jgi:hypothetical protein